MKGIANFDDLQWVGSPHSSMSIPQAKTYAHSKLLQHIWCKHYSSLMPPGVTLNVGDPGGVETNIDLLPIVKAKTGCCYSLCLKPGFRTPDEGCQPLLHMLGAPAMDGINGHYLASGCEKRA